jgi:hypothetical protein
MLFDFLSKAINFFLKQQQEKITSNSDVLHIKKRQLFHKDIPNLLTVKQCTGEKFYILLEIVNRFDPVKTEKLKDNPKKYEFLIRTLIYKLPIKRTREAIADLIELEFSLWFKHAYANFDKKEELIEDVSKFKTLYLRTDPFESFRNKES